MGLFLLTQSFSWGPQIWEQIQLVECLHILHPLEDARLSMQAGAKKLWNHLPALAHHSPLSYKREDKWIIVIEGACIDYFFWNG